MGCAGLITLIAIIGGIASGDPIALAMGIGVVIITVVIYVNQKSKENEKKIQERETLDYSSSVYQASKKDVSIPSIAKGVHCLNNGGYAGIVSGVPHYCWVDDTSLYLFPIEPNNENFLSFSGMSSIGARISFCNIEKFTQEGDVYRETKVSGGGVNIGKAVAGGVLLGGAGAILGGREQIKSDVIEHDSRQTQLFLSNPSDLLISFSVDSYRVFQQLIPFKEGQVVDEVRRRKLIEEQLRSNS